MNKLRTDIRRIITRGVIDMATSRVISSEGYDYAGPMALADDDTEKKLETALSKHFDKVSEIMTKRDADMVTYKAVQDDTKVLVAKLNEDGAKIIKELNDFRDEQKLVIKDLNQKLAARTQSGAGPQRAKSVGEQVIESQEAKDFQTVAQQGTAHKSKPIRVKNITSNPASGGAGITPQYLETPVIPNFQNLLVRDLLSHGNTTSDVIFWLQELVFTNNAANVSEGALKPQSDITYTRKNTSVVTMAHWFRATKQVMSDFGQLRALIDQRGIFGLNFHEEQQILYGDGNGDNLLGLVPQATAYNGGAASTDTFIDVIAKAAKQVRKALYPATGVVLSVDDWWNIMLTKDTQGRYIWANPQATNMPPMLWGLPVAISDSFHTGDFMVGAFKLAATLWDREDTQILLSTEDQDNFVRNMVTVLFEKREALIVSRPQALVYGSFPSGTST